MANILEVKDLNLVFHMGKKSVRAVTDVEFNVQEGETFGLVGESGCGKSTTCKAILGLNSENAEVTKGEIIFENENLLKFSEKKMVAYRGKKIGMIFQEPMTALNPVLKIRKQMYEAFDRKMSKSEKNDKAVELMKLVGIPTPEKRLDSYIHQYSGGMRQRAMIAIALAAQPRLLIADEPTTALDVTIQSQIIRLLNKLKKDLNMSIILITHDLGVVSQMCNHVGVMYAGYIVEIADKKSLFEHPSHPYTRGLLASLPQENDTRERLESITGTPPNPANLPEGCPFSDRCKYADEHCKKELPDWTEISPDHRVRCFKSYIK